MTTVDRYPSVPLEPISDVPTNGRRTHSSAGTIRRNNYIPPAVPSPPRHSDQHSPPRKPETPPDGPPAFAMASEETSQWYFTDAELASTPSILHGLPIAEERCRRAKAVNFIIQAGILLKLPQLTLATASVFLHRFYMRYSMVPEQQGIHHYNIAATSLFLATKTEENCRKTKEIVIAVAKVAQKNASLIIDEQSKEYWRWRDNILLYEEFMLEYLTFDVVLQSPYNFLYNYLQKLQVEDNKPLRNVAWAFLNDSCLTTMCLMMPPKDIAVAAVYFAAKGTSTQILDDENGAPWWEQLGGNPELIVKSIGVMNDFYTENPLRRTDNPYGQSPTSFGNEEDLDRTRGRGGSSVRSQNGEGTPLMNGNRTAEYNPAVENGQPTSPEQIAENGSATENGNVASTSEPTQSTSSAIAAQANSQPVSSGSSDTALKMAANDPATHEMNGDANAAIPLPSNSNVQPKPATVSPKRKEVEDSGEPAAKRAKTGSDESASSGTSGTAPTSEASGATDSIVRSDIGEGGESAPMVMSEDASEEGELEE